jgi:hypothetical protein
VLIKANYPKLATTRWSQKLGIAADDRAGVRKLKGFCPTASASSCATWWSMTRL